MDAARCAKRLGARRVSISSTAAVRTSCPRVRRRSHHAKEEGIEFQPADATRPEILGDENGLVSRHRTAMKMELGEPDASGRRRPVPVKDSAVRAWKWTRSSWPSAPRPNPLIKSTTQGLETQKWGGIVAEEQLARPRREGVYRRRRRRHRRGDGHPCDGRGQVQRARHRRIYPFEKRQIRRHRI